MNSVRIFKADRQQTEKPGGKVDDLSGQCGDDAKSLSVWFKLWHRLWEAWETAGAAP